MKKLILVGMLVALAVAFPILAGPAEEISGAWHFVFQTDDGERLADANFTLDGDQVHGKFHGADVHGAYTDVHGSYSNGKLDLSFPFTSEEAGPGTLKLKGQLASGVITGTWEFQQYNGAFKATRPPKP